jgi:hypothetical protein
MPKLVFTFSNDNQLFDVGNNNKVIVIENISSEYTEEICDIIEENKLPYEEIKNLVESLGGTIDMFILNHLINFYKKNYLKGYSI